MTKISYSREAIAHDLAMYYLRKKDIGPNKEVIIKKYEDTYDYFLTNLSKPKGSNLTTDFANITQSKKQSNENL